MGKQRMNRNVAATLWFTFADGITQGIWGMAILGPYLQTLTGKNEYAGYAEGAQGLCQAALAFPAGILADKIGRDRVLKGSSFLGFIAVAVLLAGLFYQWDDIKDLKAGETFENWGSKYWAIFVGLCFWGAYQGSYSPSLLTIFSDSVPHGQRSKYETWRYVTQILANASGPLANIIIYFAMRGGNNWTLYSTTLIFIIGVSACVIPIISLWIFNDKYSLVNKEIQLEEEEEDEQRLLDHEESQDSMEEGNKNAENCNKSTSDGEDSDESMDEESEKAELRIAEMELNRKWYHVPASWIPAFCVTSDIVFGLASGMTIKFFPVFFKDELELPPTEVNLVYTAGPFLMAIFSLCTQRISRKFGRIQTVCTTNLIGITLLCVMTWLQDLWKTQPYIIVVIYVFRTGFMNCTYPLVRSILMDFVTKENRGKWNSLESVSMFGWSGSAALGGYLVDKCGYGSTFYATAAMQFTGFLIQACLLPVVPHEVYDDDKENDDDDDDECILDDNNELDDPKGGNSGQKNNNVDEDDSNDGVYSEQQQQHHHHHHDHHATNADDDENDENCILSTSSNTKAIHITSSNINEGHVDMHQSPAFAVGSYHL